jgi:hypothetical protein
MLIHKLINNKKINFQLVSSYWFSVVSNKFKFWFVLFIVILFSYCSYVINDPLDLERKLIDLLVIKSKINVNLDKMQNERSICFYLNVYLSILMTKSGIINWHFVADCLQNKLRCSSAGIRLNFWFPKKSKNFTIIFLGRVLWPNIWHHNKWERVRMLNDTDLRQLPMD